MIVHEFEATRESELLDVTALKSHSRGPLINPLHRVVRVFSYLALAFVSLPLGLLLVNEQAWLWGQLFGGLFGAAMLIAAVICGVCARLVSRRLKRFQAGECLVHWTYTEDEWLAFAAGEFQRRTELARQATRVGLFTGGLVGLVLGAIVGPALSDSVSWIVAGLLGALLAATLGVLAGWLSGRLIRRFARLRYQRMRRRVGEVYIDHDAAYCDGTYWSWTIAGCCLERLELLPGSPCILQFTLRVWQGRTGTVPHTYRIPVPAGREDEARAVIARLTGGC